MEKESQILILYEKHQSWNDATPLEKFSQKKRQRPDFVMLLTIFLLMVVGVFAIASAKLASETNVAWYNTYAFRQCIWYGIGSIFMILVCLVDYKILCRYSFLVYWVCIGLLVLVLIPHVGAYRFGARRWFDLGFFQLQPSEFAKLAYIFAMTHYLGRPRAELRKVPVFFKGVGLMMLPFLLILSEPDLGSAVVLVPAGLAMLFVSGVPWIYLVKMCGVVVMVLGSFVVDVVYAPDGWKLPIEDYQRRRLLVFFGQDYIQDQRLSDVERKRLKQLQKNDSYNIEQALISVGSGGIVGKGWGEGMQTSLGFLPRPVSHNDFIFSVIAEESGFLGSSFVVALYGVLCFMGLRTASQARDLLGKILAVGIVMLLFTHIIVNIGMNIHLMPVTGIPLPLLSYGGSSVISSLVSLGILQNIYIYRKSY